MAISLAARTEVYDAHGDEYGRARRDVRPHVGAVFRQTHLEVLAKRAALA